MTAHNQQPFCLVIGAGSGGLTVAIGLAKAGKEVVLVERDKIGGDCTNTGCVPSKALLHAAKHLPAKQALEYTRSRIDQILLEESPQVLTKMGITVVFGEARFLSDQTVRVDSGGKSTEYSPKHIVIATGSRPRSLTIPGLPDSKYLTNESIFTLESPPKKLAVIGAGPVGIELSQAFARLGTQVHLLYRGTSILSAEDEGVSQLITRVLQSEGVQFHWKADSYEYKNSRLQFVEKDQKKQLADLHGVLVAIGREPNYQSLHLDSTSVEVTTEGIGVDSYMRTRVKHIFAIGDVAQGANFTHVANAQGRSVVLQLVAPFLPKRKPVPVLPAVTFTSPEVATVGLSLDELSQLDPRLVDKIQVPLATTDRGKTDSIHEGHITIWAEKLTGKLYRVTIVADAAGEMISFFTLMIQQKISLWRLTSIVIPYPVLFAAAKKAADTFATQTLGRWQSDVKIIVKSKVSSSIAKYGSPVLALTLWLLALGGLRWYMLITDQTFFDVASLLTDFFASHPLGVVAYFLAYVLRPFVFFPATILAMLAGQLFGLQLGYVYALFAGVLSAVPFFFVGRWSKNNAGSNSGMFSSYIRSVSEKPFETTLIMRLLGLPYDAVNFVCGRYGANVWSFLAATFVGNLVGTFAYVAAGASIEGNLSRGDISINPRYFLLSLGLLAISLVVSRLLSSRKS